MLLTRGFIVFNVNGVRRTQMFFFVLGHAFQPYLGSRMKRNSETSAKKTLPTTISTSEVESSQPQPQEVNPRAEPETGYHLHYCCTAASRKTFIPNNFFVRLALRDTWAWKTNGTTNLARNKNNTLWRSNLAASSRGELNNPALRRLAIANLHARRRKAKLPS